MSQAFYQQAISAPSKFSEKPSLSVWQSHHVVLFSSWRWWWWWWWSSSWSSCTQWGTADTESKDPSVENEKLRGSPFKTWSGSSTARVFFLANLYLPGPFTFVFIQNLSKAFPLLLWLMQDPVWTRRMNQVTLLIVTDNLQILELWPRNINML